MKAKNTSNMGKYPVINLSLKSAKQPNFEMAYRLTKDEIINDEFKRQSEILNRNDLFEDEKEEYLSNMNGKKQLRFNMLNLLNF